MKSLDLPVLVRRHYILEKHLEVLGGGGEQMLYRFPDGRTTTNWELIHSPEYDAFKQGFREGFEGRAAKPETVAEPLRPDYESGFRHGHDENRENRKGP